MVLGGDNMTERERLKKAIASSEARRATLGDTVVETALAPLREKLAALKRAQAREPALFTSDRRSI